MLAEVIGERVTVQDDVADLAYFDELGPVGGTPRKDAVVDETRGVAVADEEALDRMSRVAPALSI